MLPTIENLWKKKKRVLQTPRCQRCRSYEESTFHSLFECKATWKIWKLASFANEMKTLKCRDVLSLLSAVAEQRSKTKMELIVALC